ncbi:MAG: TolC family protein [Bacteroidetes bacterium]|nr:TolC family protein [Bacteroidota bacterium]
MKKIKILNIFLALIICGSVFAQNMDEVLHSVLLNNKSIRANNTYLNKLNIEAKTGLTLNNPTISYSHLWDQNNKTGYGEEFEVFQSFDFPSSYAYKNTISNLEIEKTEDSRKLFSIDILLEAKMACIEIIYLKRKKEESKIRANYAMKLVNNIRTKLQNGYTTQFELDKALISEMIIQNEYMDISNLLQKKEDHLVELNGGQAIQLNIADYPEQPIPESLNTLFEHVESVDPLNKLIELEIKIAELNIKLTRIGSLPEFEVGYKLEKSTLDKFSGVILGMSVPLWQNKNKVSVSKINMDHMKSNIVQHENEHYYHIKSIYDDYISASERLSKFQGLWNKLNYLKNIEKALEEGEISTTEYFLELKTLYELKDNLLDIEKDYQLLLSQLNKFELLKLL